MQTIKPSDYSASELAAELCSRIKELEKTGVDWKAWVQEGGPDWDEDGIMLCLEFCVAEDGSQPDFVLGHGYETALCAGYAAILTTVAASVSRAFCSALM